MRHFLFQQVVFGVHRETGQLLLGEHEGTPLWVCFTDQEVAARGLPEGYVLQQAPVREVLPALPDGIALLADPQRPDVIFLPPDGLRQLREQAVMFPEGCSARLGTHLDLAGRVRRGLRKLGRRNAFVSELRVGMMQVNDGPVQGLVLYTCDAGVEAEETVIDGVIAVLDRDVDLGVLDPPLSGVQVLAYSDLPEPLRETSLGALSVAYRR